MSRQQAVSRAVRCVEDNCGNSVGAPGACCGCVTDACAPTGGARAAELACIERKAKLDEGAMGRMADLMTFVEILRTSILSTSLKVYMTERVL